MMTETEKMQNLHLLAAQGNQLTVEEKARLERWYEMLDREESVINRNSHSVNPSALKEKIEQTIDEIKFVGEEITILLRQNENIRSENRHLRQKLQSRLAEQAA